MKRVGENAASLQFPLCDVRAVEFPTWALSLIVAAHTRAKVGLSSAPRASADLVGWSACVALSLSVILVVGLDWILRPMWQKPATTMRPLLMGCAGCRGGASIALCASLSRSRRALGAVASHRCGSSSGATQRPVPPRFRRAWTLALGSFVTMPTLLGAISRRAL